MVKIHKKNENLSTSKKNHHCYKDKQLRLKITIHMNIHHKDQIHHQDDQERDRLQWRRTREYLLVY